MKTYKVYVNEDSDYKAVKEGFSWTGLFFSFLWAVFHKLWVVALSIFLIGLVITYAQEYIGFILEISIRIGIIVYVGFYGNSIITNNLIMKGYHLSGEVSTKSYKDAISTFKNSAAATNADILKNNEISVKCANCKTELIIELKAGEPSEFICPECQTENEIV